MQDNTNWFAAKVFFNKTKLICKALEDDGIRFYTQTIIPSLIFIRCGDDYIGEFRAANWQRLMVYKDRKSGEAIRIPDKEMESFILVTTSNYDGLEYLGDDLPEYHQGDKVRVIDGPFKGAEGHIKRIKRDRRLIVTINGLAAVATSFIHPKYLQKI